ncbi:MAG: L,D-transpeptidase family protein [Desulfobacteraceae bacterium]|jgi:murein L,D-transpeptidase YcbB/YkuD
MKNTLFVIVLATITLLWTLPAGASPQNYHNSAGDQLRSWLQPYCREAMSPGKDLKNDALLQIARFYDRRGYEPVWADPHGLLPHGAEVLETLRQYAAEGEPGLSDHLDNFEKMLDDGLRLVASGLSMPPEDFARLDVRFTQIVMHYVVSLRYHYWTPFEGGKSAEDRLFRQLADALEAELLDDLLAASQPQHIQYRALRSSLKQYETIKLLGGWPQIKAGPKMRLGRRDGRVPVLRWRLVISGDMTLDQLSAEEIFDAVLTEAVRKFQRRHGLKVDGVVGKRTRAMLNVPVEDRILQLKANIERWWRMPIDLGTRYLMVNIPNYQLHIVENNTVVKSIRAIVGKQDRRTPVFSTKMTYLELNPYWNVPQKIASRDLLPRIQNNPQFLIRQRIQVFKNWNAGARELDPLAVDWNRYSKENFNLRLRQKPARFNALGLVKFIFPNRYSVYIHDTPGKALFRKRKRSYSSGCIRIEEPFALAEYLLKDQQWDRSELLRRVRTNKRKVIALKSPIPVHLVYFTSWIDDAGTTHFREDLYGRDHRLSEEMARGTPAFETANLIPLQDNLMASINQMLARDLSM